MSEQNEERVAGPIGDGDEERTEYGRQLAMDSILGRACRDAFAAHRGSEPRRGRALLLAAVLLVGVGLGLWSITGAMLRPGEEPDVAEFSEASESPTPSAKRRTSDPMRAPTNDVAELQEVVGASRAYRDGVPIGKDSITGMDIFVDPGRAALGEERHFVFENREEYDRIVENGYRRAREHQLSTFSIDVDTAAYANIRDLLTSGKLPRPDAVRIEEMVNYFDYDYPHPTGAHPLALHVDMAQAPWAPRHRLVRIGLQAKNLHVDRPRANLVFLVDVSGSMSPDNKLPLLKRCMARLVTALRDDDRIAIVVYAGAAGLVLDSTAVGDEEKVLSALARLSAGGSTNGGAGIDLAYDVATENFVENGINRVILASDGDFNVGVSDRASLIRMIEAKRDSGVFLSVLGFGRGNLRDSQMEQIANKGNGTYSYIDSMEEGHRVLVDKIGSTLVTVAEDVKIQVEFNPALVAGYRLIGYENRMLAKQDFNDDTKDAGEVGSGHTVTALYEVIPAAVGFAKRPAVDPLRYGKDGRERAKPRPTKSASDELLFVKVRYKLPHGDTSAKITLPVEDSDRDFDSASADFRFAASVAAFGMILRRSRHKGLANYASVLDMAEGALGEDAGGYRNGFLKLVGRARELDARHR